MRLEFEQNVQTIPLAAHASVEMTGSQEPEQVLKNGIAAAQNGDRAKAREFLMLASEEASTAEDAWMWLASISEYPEELLAFLNNVLTLNPNNGKASEWRVATRALLAKTFVQRAVVAREQGDQRQAQTWLDEAIAHDVRCVAAWMERAAVAADDDEREEIYARVVEIDPDNESAKSGLGEIRRGRSEDQLNAAKAAVAAGSQAQANEILNALIADDPANLDALLLRAYLSTNLDEKLRDLQAVLTVDPENLVARSSYDFLRSTVSAPSVEPTTSSEEPAAPRQEVPTDENAQFFVAQEADDHADAPWVETPYAQAAPDAPIFDNQAADGQNESSFALEDQPYSIDANAVPPVVEFDASPVVDPFATITTNMQPEPHEDAESFSNMPQQQTRTVPEIFGAVQPTASPDYPTVESLHTTFDTDDATNTETPEFASDARSHDAPADAPCPFCRFLNGHQAFECESCHASLSFSDVESVLANRRVERVILKAAVAGMEAEAALRPLSVKELTELSLGHVQLGDLDAGLKYLQAASELDPMNVILTAEVTTLAIRIDETRRHQDLHRSEPATKRILVVDDSATVRKLISSKLEKSGHTVISAEDGVEALARLDEGKPDLILLDIAMPRMDGYEVCREVRARENTKHLPVVMISGKDGFFDKVRGRMAGATGYVTKPFGPETLMKALDEYLTADRSNAVEEYDPQPETEMATIA